MFRRISAAFFIAPLNFSTIPSLPERLTSFTSALAAAWRSAMAFCVWAQVVLSLSIWAWAEAMATSDKPVILEVVTDRETPPLPPHIKMQQAQMMMSAIAAGDQDRVGMMKKSARGKLDEFKESLS